MFVTLHMYTFSSILFLYAIVVVVVCWMMFSFHMASSCSSYCLYFCSFCTISFSLCVLVVYNGHSSAVSFDFICVKKTGFYGICLYIFCWEIQRNYLSCYCTSVFSLTLCTCSLELKLYFILNIQRTNTMRYIIWIWSYITQRYIKTGRYSTYTLKFTQNLRSKQTIWKKKTQRNEFETNNSIASFMLDAVKLTFCIHTHTHAHTL